MTSRRRATKNIDEYMAGFPSDIRTILQKIRTTIVKAAPGAEEAIKYGIPTFMLEGNLVHFAAFKKHIGFFPPVRGDEQLKKRVSAYAGPKGNLRFPLDAPIPYALIARIVKLRVKQNRERVKANECAIKPAMRKSERKKK